MALKGVKSAVDELQVAKGAKSLSASKNGHIGLVVSQKGLQFPLGFALSAEECIIRVTATDTELCISSGRCRLIHRSKVVLPFYAYKIAVEVGGNAYIIALPPDLLNVLGEGSELGFDVYVV